MYSCWQLVVEQEPKNWSSWRCISHYPLMLNSLHPASHLLQAGSSYAMLRLEGWKFSLVAGVVRSSEQDIGHIVPPGHPVSPWVNVKMFNRSGQGAKLLYVPYQTDGWHQKQVANLTLMSARQSLVLSSFVLMVTARGFLSAFRGFITAESQSHLQIHHCLWRDW